MLSLLIVEYEKLIVAFWVQQQQQNQSLDWKIASFQSSCTNKCEKLEQQTARRMGKHEHVNRYHNSLTYPRRAFLFGPIQNDKPLQSFFRVNHNGGRSTGWNGIFTQNKVENRRTCAHILKYFVYVWYAVSQHQQQQHSFIIYHTEVNMKYFDANKCSWPNIEFTVYVCTQFICLSTFLFCE